MDKGVWFRFSLVVSLLAFSSIAGAERLEYSGGKQSGAHSHSVYDWFGQKHVYVRGFFGGAVTHWADTANASYSFTQHADSSYTLGFGGGVPLTSSLSVDAGYLYFPKAKYTNSGSDDISQWLFYSAVKMHYLVMNSLLDFYLKAGLSARDVTYASNQSFYVRPMLGMGCDYPVMHRFSLGAEYLYFGAVGNNSAGHYIPAIGSVMLSGSYAFSA